MTFQVVVIDVSVPFCPSRLELPGSHWPVWPEVQVWVVQQGVVYLLELRCRRLLLDWLGLSEVSADHRSR